MNLSSIEEKKKQAYDMHMNRVKVNKSIVETYGVENERYNKH